ncbi:hypothetical protein ACHAWF_017633 [Thalassiosira exigua]
MGIRGILKELPGGDARTCQRTGFEKLDFLSGDKRLHADIDAMTLAFVVAIRHKEAFNRRIYAPSAADFQRQIVVLKQVHKWDFTLIFDGKSPPEKIHEHRRRKAKEGGISITPAFIAICIRICQGLFVPFIVAPFEADMQVARIRPDAIAVCRDSDELGYGNKKVVFVDTWPREEFRVVDLSVPITEAMEEELPVYWYYRQFGIRVIHWWAAVMGCDISQNESGIIGAGPTAFIAALRAFKDTEPTALLAPFFAKKLREEATPRCRLSYGEKAIADELDRVSQWFSSGGSFYDKDSNIFSVSGKLARPSSAASRRHMRGEINPKTFAEFTAEEKGVIESIRPHNLLHNSEASREKINGLSLPANRETIASCRGEELKAMVIARGGSVTGRDGKALRVPELRRIVRAYLSLEKENPKHTVYFDRSRQKNGLFAHIDTSERKTVPQILAQLVRCGEFESSLNQLFLKLQQLMADGKFVEDYATIALEAPELQESFIHGAFVHVGENVSQKNVWSGLHRVQEMNELIYHAIAWGEDNASVYILSKQNASQTRDEKTRSKTAPGEKPKLAQYLVAVQLLVRPTTVDSHGHTLGVVDRVMRSYCAACKAGCGMCYHRAALLWMQHLHWGEGRPTPKPATSSFCPWVRGSRSKRNCSTVEPASRMNIERLPRSNKEAEAKLARDRKYNLKEGIDARYDVFGGDSEKWGKLNNPEFASARQLAPLFEALEKSQTADDSDSDASDDDDI